MVMNDRPRCSVHCNRPTNRVVVTDVVAEVVAEVVGVDASLRQLSKVPPTKSSKALLSRWTVRSHAARGT